jgi:hypothetical protein
LALTSSTIGGRSVGIVRSWTQAMEFNLSHCTVKKEHRYALMKHKVANKDFELNRILP